MAIRGKTHPKQAIFLEAASYLRKQIIQVHDTITISVFTAYVADLVGLRVRTAAWQLLHRNRQEVEGI